MAAKSWRQEEVAYLEENWGTIAIPSIAKKLNRSVNSVKLKALRLGLENYLESGDYITLHQLLKGLGLSNSYSWYIEKFLKADLPFTNKKRINNTVRVIQLDKFWKWAEQNKGIMDFKNFEENSLGKEPDWVREKRKADIAAARYKKTPWTKSDDNILKSLLSHYRYGYKEISERLNRTECAVKRRILDLGLKARPVKAPNHTKWTEKELNYAINMTNKGYTVDVIAERLENRSALAVRGALERLGLI